ncbi:Uncharacterised protein [Collinsella intestinalis]|nr:Uncharacterised protein [Collinsella intestinalis]
MSDEAAPPEPAMATITSMAMATIPPVTTRRRLAFLFMRLLGNRKRLCAAERTCKR